MTDFPAPAAGIHAAETARIDAVHAATGGPAHVPVSLETLEMLGEGGYGERWRTPAGRAAHLIGADPAILLERHPDLPEPVADLLRGAVGMGACVNVFPASRCICIA